MEFKHGFLKKLAYLCAAATVVFAVGMTPGCGSDDDDTTSTTTTSTTTAAATTTTTAVTTTTTAATTTTTTIPNAVAGNVFLDSLGGVFASKNYKFLHGSTSPDGTKMFVIVNNAATPQGTTDGTNTAYILNATALTQGTVTALVGPVTITGGAGTITFRSNWTADGTKIMLAGADRFFVLNAATLAVMNGANGDNNIGGENHDALPTTDGKYAILTLRHKPHAAPNDTKYDGSLQLYDVTTGAKIGGLTSVCNDCHGDPTRSSVLCGIDGVITKQTNGTYTGTVYVAGHGGHIAKAALTIDPANTTTPITASVSKINVGTSSQKLTDGTSIYKLHDVRLDGTILYWSTYNLDANNMLHYGKVSTSGGTVTDNTIARDARVTSPAAATNAMPHYCASGQNAKAHMPMTMTNEAYITVIPK
ncbi:MAG: hypothetical protein HZA20_11230 [Nitrospirae bacterium]|nr:hypothetical protein [Nitrospirota bacterium]